jgi:hypothetical protein
MLEAVNGIAACEIGFHYSNSSYFWLDASCEGAIRRRSALRRLCYISMDDVKVVRICAVALIISESDKHFFC